VFLEMRNVLEKVDFTVAIFTSDYLLSPNSAPPLTGVSARKICQRWPAVCLEVWPVAKGWMALESGVIGVERGQFLHGHKRVPRGDGLRNGYAG
jgi:hypothetical protein